METEKRQLRTWSSAWGNLALFARTQKAQNEDGMATLFGGTLISFLYVAGKFMGYRTISKFGVCSSLLFGGFAAHSYNYIAKNEKLWKEMQVQGEREKKRIDITLDVLDRSIYGKVVQITKENWDSQVWPVLLANDNQKVYFAKYFNRNIDTESFTNQVSDVDRKYAIGIICKNVIKADSI